MIESGRVTVNGSVVDDFSMNVDLDVDSIAVDGKPLSTRDYQYLILNKPKDVLTTCDDPQGRKTVMDLLPDSHKHLKPVGRLDRASEGLLVLTNDGELANYLAHPKDHIWKTYKVSVKGKLDQESVKKLESGVELKDGLTLPAKVEVEKVEESNSSFLISIREGRNRQIRRMCSSLGYPVTRLVRVAIGRLQLNRIAPGQWIVLTKDEIKGYFGTRG